MGWAVGVDGETELMDGFCPGSSFIKLAPERVTRAESSNLASGVWRLASGSGVWVRRPKRRNPPMVGAGRRKREAADWLVGKLPSGR
ncbi:MAG TPA: hypothetical protein VJQ79_01010, partial [Acidimicrobiia bacterium]|nr:hypothetical protein [Acidimicrobiia bacterium]